MKAKTIKLPSFSGSKEQNKKKKMREKKIIISVAFLFDVIIIGKTIK